MEISPWAFWAILGGLRRIPLGPTHLNRLICLKLVNFYILLHFTVNFLSFYACLLCTSVLTEIKSTTTQLTKTDCVDDTEYDAPERLIQHIRSEVE